MSDVANWLIWKEKCALALCPIKAQLELAFFVGTRFRRYASTCSAAFRGLDAEALNPTASQSWHWFETYFKIHSTRQGKSYKEWLFSRSAAATGPDIETLEGGVSLLLRNVVREQLRSEYSSSRVVSLQTNTCPYSGSGQPTMEDMLPDPTTDTFSEVVKADICRQAEQLTGAVFLTLSRRQRVAILGREVGASLTHPVLLKAAACKKSALSDAYSEALHLIASHVANTCQSEARNICADIAIAVFNGVRHQTIVWANAEKRLSGLLKGVEAQTCRTGCSGSPVKQPLEELTS